MPEFLSPFTGMTPNRKMTNDELVRAIRLDLAAEHEAVTTYLCHADATEHPLAKAVLIDIANEERVHAGEFSRLIAILTGDEDACLRQGMTEVDAIAALLVQQEDKKPDEKTKATIGSLKTP
jgi:rubrerythrin